MHTIDSALQHDQQTPISFFRRSGLFSQPSTHIKKDVFSRIPLILWIFFPGLFFWLAWEPMPITPLVFIAFVPLFYISAKLLHRSGWRYFGALFLSLFFWNICNTWWVWFASDIGAVTMLFINSMLMLLPFSLFRLHARFVKKNPLSFFSKLDVHWLFILVWLLYEFGHHRWDLSWPWLCLGNAFSGMTWFVQWYEITGTQGGSCLILIVNYWLFRGLIIDWKTVFFERRTTNSKQNARVFFNLKIANKTAYFACIVGLLAMLTAISLAMLYRINPSEGKPYRVISIQPNYDPFEEKFTLPPMAMMRQMWQTTYSAIQENSSSSSAKQENAPPINCILWPETSLINSVNVDFMQGDEQVDFILQKFSTDPLLRNAQILVGATMVQWDQYTKTTGKPNPSARQSNDPSLWYTVFNSALMFSHTASLKSPIGNKPQPEQPLIASQTNKKIHVAFYHKSKLVPGTEKLPFSQTFPFLEQLAVSLDENSTTGSLGKSNQAIALGKSEKTAPIICYESIYGDYVSEFVKDGAQWLSIITNDAWWDNTPGHKQHFSYAKLRAIEQRKWVVRSANTGISGFIDPRGTSTLESIWYEGRPEKMETSVGGLENFRENKKISTTTNQQATDPYQSQISSENNQLSLCQTIYLNGNKTLYNRLGDTVILCLLSTIILLFAYFDSRYYFRL
ncbi:MAG: apolipoprotein N-acyltransferase [Flavobacteriaceae bacterium]|nr:apolipoprotein N-acyltransferase [Flavobacteriaceae bacterium]